MADPARADVSLADAADAPRREPAPQQSGQSQRSGRPGRGQSPHDARWAPPAAPPLTRRERLGLAAICLVALALRAWNLRELAAHDPFFLAPAVDAGLYHAWAQRIAAGEWLGERAFWSGPLYPYALGALYALVGPSIAIAKGVQAVLGAACCVPTWWLGRRYFSPAAGLVAAALVAASLMLIFYGGALLLMNLFVPLLLCALCALVWAVERPHAARFAVAGLLVAAAALTRANALGLAVIGAFWAWRALAGASRARRARWLAAYAGAIVVGIAPATLHNLAAEGDWVWITWSGGPNLFLGNNPEADGTFRIPRAYPASIVDDPLEQQDVFRRHAEQIEGRRLASSEVSRFWSGQALRYAWLDPAGWLRLLWRKLRLSVHHGEIWNVRSLALTREASAVLRLPLVDFRLLGPFALLGLLVSARRWRRLLPLYAALAAVFALLLIAFVLSRYRAPAIPVLAVFAGGGAVALARALRAGARREWLGALLVLALGLKLVSGPGAEIGLSTAYYNLGNRHLASARWPEAIGAYERALRERPSYLSAWNNLALAYEGAGDADSVERARAIWRRIRAWGEARGLAHYVARADRHLAALGPSTRSEDAPEAAVPAESDPEAAR